MEFVFELNKKNLELSRAEIEVLAGKKGKLVGNLLIIDAQPSLVRRLAFTKAVYEFFFSTTTKQLRSRIKTFDWQKHYKKNFRVTAHHTIPAVEREIAGLVWQKLKKPKVKLRNARTDFHFFFFDNKVVACKLLGVNTENFGARRAHLWPAPHPTAMHPQLARCCVNLTGIKQGTIMDPMCGGGGILIEAGLLGFRVKGLDINPVMVEKARKNLKGFKIKDFIVQIGDARKLSGKIPYVVTDVPYGINTPKKELENLIAEFLKSVKKVLTKKSVIVFPHFVNYKKLIKQAKLKPQKEFSWYVHHALTRKIMVLTP